MPRCSHPAGPADQRTLALGSLLAVTCCSRPFAPLSHPTPEQDWDYFLWLHGAHGGAVVGAEFDVTGGASHFATWHGAHTLDFETSLLAVDPAIEALPYLDWVAMPVRSALFNEYLGEPSDAALLAYYEGWKDCSKWSVRCATWQVMGHSEYMRFALSQDSGLGIIDNGPFRNWPVATGGLVSPGGRTLTTLARQKSIQDVKFSGNDWVAFWGDADGFLAALRAKQPAGVFAGLPAPLFDLLKDYSLDLNATQWRDPFLAAPVPFLVRNVRAPPEPSYQQVENGTFVAELVETCLELGSWFGELVNCLQGRLAEQTFDMHDNWHTSLGGDVMGIGGPNDPAFWFHHAAVDKLRLHWQARNPQLRSRAWGYFVKGSFSSRDTCQSANSALTDLNDVIGAPPNGESEGNPKLWAHRHDELLFGVGFDRERLMGRADAGMEATVSTPMTNADMLCGDVEALYTFDVIVADEQRAQRRQASLAQTAQVAWVSLLLSLLGMAVLLRPTLRVLHARCGGDGGIGGRAGSGAGVPARMAAAVLPGSRAKRYGAKRPYEEYDMTFNDASDQARGAEVHAPRR